MSLPNLDYIAKYLRALAERLKRGDRMPKQNTP